MEPQNGPGETEAVRQAKRVIKHFLATDPATARWILDGHPSLTDQEYEERFGHKHPSTIRKDKQNVKDGPGAYTELW